MNHVSLTSYWRRSNLPVYVSNGLKEQSCESLRKDCCSCPSGLLLRKWHQLKCVCFTLLVTGLIVKFISTSDAQYSLFRVPTRKEIVLSVYGRPRIMCVPRPLIPIYVSLFCPLIESDQYWLFMWTEIEKGITSKLVRKEKENDLFFLTYLKTCTKMTDYFCCYRSLHTSFRNRS